MKNIKILSLAAAILIATAIQLRSEPPTFSQRNLCCWIASWVQLVYNMRPVAERLLTVDEKLFSDFEVFKNSDMGKKLANEKTEIGQQNPKTNKIEFVEITMLEKAKDFFTPKIIELISAYKTLFTAMHAAKRNQNELDEKIEALQKLLQPKKFGESTLPNLDEGQGLVGHINLKDLTRRSGGGNFLTEGLTYKYADLTPILLMIFTEPDNPLKIGDVAFSPTDITTLLPGLTERREKHLQYELTGMVVSLGHHWIAFIKDQYDPMQQWWRCDTLNGNRKVTHQEIIAECTQHLPTYFVYTIKQDDSDLIRLAQILKDLSAT